MKGKGPILLAAFALLAFVSDASGQAPAPPAPTPPGQTAAPADTVVSRTDNTQPVLSSDLKLILSKQKREEHAIIRRLIFIAASLRLTEPTGWTGDEPAPQTCRFEFRSFLQRQQCFVSMTGALACGQAEVIPLPDEAHGDAPPPEKAAAGFCNDAFRPAISARVRLTGRLADRAAELFATDQKEKVEPVFKAAGLAVRPEPAPGPGSPSLPGKPATPRRDPAP